MQNKVWFMFCALLLFCNTVSLYRAMNPQALLCRDVVIADIRESKKYNAELDRTLNPDLIDQLKGAKP